MSEIKQSADNFKKMVNSESGQKREIWGGTIVRTLVRRIEELEADNLRLTTKELDK